MVTPLTVTPEWLRRYLREREGKKPDIEARLAASRASGISGKEFARCRIATGVLSVPVAGGAGLLKRHDTDPPLAEHGKWRREHLGAWAAAYGRTPWFIHLMPRLEEVYMDSAGLRLEEFNSRLLAAALDWLDPAAVALHRERLGGVIAETRARVSDGLSVFDLIFRLGRDAVFALF